MSTPTAFRNDGVTTPAVGEYLAALNWHPDELQQEMFEHAKRDSIPIVSTDTGMLLELLVRLHRPRHIFEFGTAIGYSTLFMARGLTPTGILTSYELDEERHAQAKAYLGRAELECTLNLRCGDAIEGMRGVSGGIEFAFLDATKGEYAEYLDLTIDRMSNGGVVVVDNALMSGTVATGEGTVHWGQADVDGQRAFNEAFVDHPRLRNGVVLSIGDGIAIAQRR